MSDADTVYNVDDIVHLIWHQPDTPPVGFTVARVLKPFSIAGNREQWVKDNNIGILKDSIGRVVCVEHDESKEMYIDWLIKNKFVEFIKPMHLNLFYSVYFPPHDGRYN